MTNGHISLLIPMGGHLEDLPGTFGASAGDGNQCFPKDSFYKGDIVSKKKKKYNLLIIYVNLDKEKSFFWWWRAVSVVWGMC